MILNVSGRTDVVAFYSEWFINRYNEGYVDVRNPFNPSLVSRINFDDVDIIVFCTKNPIPIIEFLPNIDKPVEFQITLTPYKNDIEPGVYNKKEIIEGIKKISEIIGKEHVSVRYDPIFLNDKYNLEYHKKAFSRLCEILNGYANRIIISFIDDYKNVRKNLNVLKIIEFTENDYRELGTSFSKSAKENNLIVHTCFEDRNLVEYGLSKGECMSHEYAYKLSGKLYKKWKARKCNCCEMVDIGVYNTCKHFCKYCYANYDEDRVIQNIKSHNPNSSLLIGELMPNDIIKVRKG